MDNCQTATAIVSPAKINIGLRVVGRRPNGYHELESLFWPLNVCDTLYVRPAPQFSLDTSWSDSVPSEHRHPLPPSEANLVSKAVAKLKQDPNFEIVLSKSIPMGGGMGGGSSNAGSYLKEMIKRGVISKAEALGVAIQLGADVPFFLESRPSWVTGIGEVVTPIKLDPQVLNGIYFLLLLLPTGTPTVEVFQRFRGWGRFSERQSPPPEIRLRSELWDYFAQSQNDLEPAAISINPLISKALNALRQTPSRLVAMSGSGSTCFAVFENEAARQESDKALRQFCRQFQCRTLKAETYVA